MDHSAALVFSARGLGYTRLSLGFHSMDWRPGGLAWMLVRVVRTRCRRCAVLVRVQCSWVRRCCVWRPINGMVRKKQLARHHGGGVRERSGRMRCRRKGVVEGYGRRVGVGLDPVG